MSELNLPSDLTKFLNECREFEYDATQCEAGATKLHRLADLKVQFFPMETGSLESFEKDPNYPKQNSYLVPAVDLIRSCTGDYDPVGLLMWFPQESQYGMWDSSHCFLSLFQPDVTWMRIVESPASHINAQWTGRDPHSPPTAPLIPWPKYEYADGQYYEPLDY